MRATEINPDIVYAIMPIVRPVSLQSKGRLKNLRPSATTKLRGTPTHQEHVRGTRSEGECGEC